MSFWKKILKRFKKIEEDNEAFLQEERDYFQKLEKKLEKEIKKIKKKSKRKRSNQDAKKNLFILWRKEESKEFS